MNRVWRWEEYSVFTHCKKISVFCKNFVKKYLRKNITYAIIIKRYTGNGSAEQNVNLS